MDVKQQFDDHTEAMLYPLPPPVHPSPPPLRVREVIALIPDVIPDVIADVIPDTIPDAIRSPTRLNVPNVDGSSSWKPPKAVDAPPKYRAVPATARPAATITADLAIVPNVLGGGVLDSSSSVDSYTGDNTPLSAAKARTASS
jgi:hypothetical protein